MRKETKQSLFKTMICNKRKASNKSTKIKTTSKIQDEKGKTLPLWLR
jgi:hypothetical protein